MALRVAVEVTDETGAAGFHLALIRGLARMALESEGLDGSYQVTVSIVSDQRIREMNKQYRELDDVTDVLSFPLTEQDGARFVLPAEAPTHLGDIVVALPRAQEQARAFGHSFERELAYLTTHGLLHLLGYDHDDDEERLHMRAREEEILSPLALTRE